MMKFVSMAEIRTVLEKAWKIERASGPIKEYRSMLHVYYTLGAQGHNEPWSRKVQVHQDGKAQIEPNNRKNGLISSEDTMPGQIGYMKRI